MEKLRVWANEQRQHVHLSPSDCHDIERGHPVQSVESHEFAEISIRPNNASSLTKLATTAKALQDLVTLAAFSPAGIVKRTLWSKPTSDEDDPRVGPREIEVLGRLVYIPGTKPKTEPYQFLFTLADVAFPDIIPAWLEIYERASLPCGMLFGTQYQSSGYTGTQTFIIASAAEGLHRALHDSTALPDEDFIAAKKAILKALSGNANKPARKLIHEQLHNDLSFSQRMSELADLPDADMVDALLSDRERWIQLLKDGRNGTAHADHSRSEERADLATPLRVARITYALMCIVLMAELRISSEVQRKAIQVSDIAFAITAFRDAILF